ncbi:rRNA adenine N-6-methyltransferase family protein [Roseiarcaceae bacterium H3SJ34-1]|uniref:protein-L-isoaspartate O-methyltransferase family protein n=1 Tax=Terripilifer ovatus TaxID=3032367 RepID=UPI003AB9B5FB|nr:rRNA adenine N-6-methyltransferase family protein [Roseiarcaceae bacterium H3SJ34-1]
MQEVETASGQTIASRADQARMAFVLRLRARGVSDLNVLRALEMVPRELFVPHRHADLAWRDLALPIACGQTMPEPYLVARMMEGLQVERSMRVYEIGTGSGYATAILATLAGEVVSCERYRMLALQATMRLEQMRVDNVRIDWRDGLVPASEHGVFDRILIHGSVGEISRALLSALAPSGLIVCAQSDAEGRVHLVRISRPRTGDALTVTPLTVCRLGPLTAGKSDEL